MMERHVSRGFLHATGFVSLSAFLLAWLGASVAVGAASVPSERPPSSLHVTRATSSIKLDGLLDEQAWKDAARVDAFLQAAPYSGAPPSEPTDARVTYDDQAVYFGFHCIQQKNPIVERLTRRDRDSETEWVSVEIDSRREGKVAYQFAVNVAGVLIDGVVHDGRTLSFEWDENWEAETHLVPGGWSAEIRIPFRALRFVADRGTASFAVRLVRLVSATQENDDWPLVARDNATPIPFFAILDGFENIHPGGRLEVRPFVLGQVRRDGDPATTERGLYPSVAAGLDLKLHLTESLTLDVATLPDFAQVEADQVVLNLNNYEILYPEKRPLFLEGAESFETQLQLFYSRRIGSISETPVLRPASATSQETLVRAPGPPPIYASAKLAGRLGESWNVVGLSALVARSAADVDVQDPSGGHATERRTLAPRSLMNVLRVRREWDNQSHLGLLTTAANRFQDASDLSPCPAVLAQTGTVVTGQCFHDAYAAAADGLWRSPGGTYFAASQVGGTWLPGGRDALQPDGNVIAPGAKSPVLWGKLAKDGGPHWVGSLAYTHIGRDADFNDLGYMQRQNLANGHFTLEYRTLQPGNHTWETHTKLELDSRFNLDGVNLAQNASLGWRGRLLNYLWITLTAIGGLPRYDDREVGAMTGFQRMAFERERYVGLRTNFLTDLRRPVVAEISSEATAIRGDAYALKGKAAVYLHPLSQLECEITPEATWDLGEPRLAWNSGSQDASTLYFGRLDARSLSLTLRASYAFVPRLSLQAYAQAFLASGHYSNFSAYRSRGPSGGNTRLIHLADLEPTQDLLDADFEEAALNVNLVLRWEWALGSTLFFVYTRAQAPSLALGPGAAASLDVSALRNAGAVDVVLLKLSYWWAS